MRKLLLSAALLLTLSMNAQLCFDAGNGSNGPYSATVNTTLAGGTYNYTTFNINSGVVVTVTGTQPLIIRCTGAVTINGILNCRGGNGADAVTFSNAGAGGIGVAGGANGGAGTYSSSVGPLPGIAGSGLGGANNQGDAWSGGGGAGYATTGGNSGNSAGGFGGPSYGTNTIIGLESGSGGGGGSGGYSCGGGGGGGGGGIVYITSGVSISIGATGGISVNGGNGGSDGTGNCGGGGGGSGGSIILMTPAFTNNGQLQAVGGTGGASNVPGNPYYGTGANGAAGRIRLDYTTIAGSGTYNPAVGYTGTIGSALSVAAVQTSSVSCFGGSNGAALATIMNGNGPYTSLWTPTGGSSTVATGLTAGTYTFTTTDASGCTASTTVSITQPTAISLSISTTDALCFGSATGSASANVTGGTPTYTYAWAPFGGSAATATGLVAGCYTCTVTDANGCTSMQTVCITEPSQLQAVSTTMNVSCFGQCDGSAAISITGGTAPYTYMWVPGNQTAPSVNGLCAGCYTVTVTDANGCTYTELICVTQPPALPTGFLGNDTVICLNDVFSLCAPSGYSSYLWSNASTAMCINADTTTCYSVTLTDVNGCSTMDTVCVTEDPCLGITGPASLSDAVFPNPSTGVIRILHGEASPQTVTVVDSQGRICVEKNVADNGELDLSGLAAGVYFVEFNHTQHRLVIAK